MTPKLSRAVSAALGGGDANRPLRNAGNVKPFSRMSASVKIKTVLEEIEKNGYSKKGDFSIGTLGKDTMRFASSHGIDVGNGQIYILRKFLTHGLRNSKRDKRVSKEDIITFPKSKNKMVKFWDGDAFIFTDFKVKFIVKPGREVRLKNGKTLRAAIVTAGRVGSKTDFNGKEYVKI